MKKDTPNIDYMLSLARDYIEGNGNPFTFELDYGYELEKRYDAMVKEDRRVTELIFDHLVREGSDYATSESGDKLRARVRKEYEYVMSVSRKRS